MCSHKPLSWAQCRYRAIHRTCGYQLSYKVLGLILLQLLSSVLWAEGTDSSQKYYVWVDADGRVHNTPINKEPSPDILTEAKDTDPLEQTSAEPSLLESEKYLTEEQIQQKLKDYDEENPAFYIWMDENGQVHTQNIDQDAEKEAQEVLGKDSQAVIAHHILAPPFRVSEEITNALCCEEYSDQIVEIKKQHKAKELFDPKRNWPFYTRSGNKKAWYFGIGNIPNAQKQQRFMELSIHGERVEAFLIAMDAGMQPLYLLTQVEFDYYPETWKSVQYQQTMVAIEDDQVANFVLYLNMTPQTDISLEVKWANGEYPL